MKDKIKKQIKQKTQVQTTRFVLPHENNTTIFDLSRDDKFASGDYDRMLYSDRIRSNTVIYGAVLEQE